MPGIYCRDARRAGQRHAQGFGNGGHGAGRAHRHTGAGTACNATDDAVPFRFVQEACAPVVPVLESIGAGAQGHATRVASQHRAGRQEYGRQVRAGSAQQHGGAGLVAAAHQHHGIDRIATDHLLHFHRHHVAVEQRRGLHDRVIERDRRHFEGKATGLQHAALDVVDTLAKVHVAGIEVRPAVQDGNQRLAFPVLAVVPHLHDPGAMVEGAKVIVRQPALAAQFFQFRHYSGSRLSPT